YLRLHGIVKEAIIEVSQSDRGQEHTGQAAAIAKAMEPWLDGRAVDAAVLTLPHPIADRSVHINVTPIGYRQEFGLIAVGASRPNFPAEEERLLLKVVANEAAVVLQRQQVEDALRNSEQQLRHMANAVPVVVWTAVPDGTITFASDHWYAYTGLTPDDPSTDWARRVLHPDDFDRCMQQWTAALHAATEYEIEVRYRRHDGEYR